jgi:Flp pilus assembly CpaE family ATPase
MDQIVVVVDPVHISLAMARELLRELENSSTVAGRIHVVVVNHAHSAAQIPWNDVEQILGRELRAIISDARELASQAVRAGMPMVMFQPNAIVANQIVKLSEDLNLRIRAIASSQLIT